MPVLTVIAGPNGSGKSTITSALDFAGRANLLDPDAIAGRLSPADPRRALIASGREIVRRIQNYLDARVSFAIETTLASQRTLETMRSAKANGFRIDLVYICLDTPERSVLRVNERVLQGGHDVSDEDVRRRYMRSLANLPEAVRIADRAVLYDNSGDEYRRMLEIRQGVAVWIAAKPVAWAAELRKALAGSAALTRDLEQVRQLGEGRPGEFFRAIESLADSFDPARALEYERLMGAWGLRPVASASRAPENAEIVYVLSRVTLGADIKITSVVLDAMKKRYPGARVVFVGGRKSAELLGGEHCEVEYPRKGPVSARIAWASHLRERLRDGIIVDPDSRITQLGLVEICEPERYFHFPSRTVGSETDNLTDLTNAWLRSVFGVEGEAYIAPPRVAVENERPIAAVSFGVGENESKRIGGDFEALVLRLIGERYRTVWVDRGAGGEEAQRVTAAAEASGIGVRFWEGSFAGFASVISQSDVYVGYDSAGQHAAAAAGVRSFTIFRGAPSKAFRYRWAPIGRGESTVLGDRAEDTPEDCIHMLQLALDGKRLG